MFDGYDGNNDFGVNSDGGGQQIGEREGSALSGLNATSSPHPPSLAPRPSATIIVMPRRFCIQTVGCQMNVLDSELVTGGWHSTPLTLF